MRYGLLALALLGLFVCPVRAAEVSYVSASDGGVAWLDMNSQTTSAEEYFWAGGCLQFHVQGTYDAQISVIHRPELRYASNDALVTTTASNIDVDEAPDGLFFTSATKSQANLARGWIDLRFDSAGGATMDADLIATSFPWGCRD